MRRFDQLTKEVGAVAARRITMSARRMASTCLGLLEKVFIDFISALYTSRRTILSEALGNCDSDSSISAIARWILASLEKEFITSMVVVRMFSCVSSSSTWQRVSTRQQSTTTSLLLMNSCRYSTSASAPAFFM